MDFGLLSAGVVSAVNPREIVQITPSAGSSTPNAAGQRTPLYGKPTNRYAQFQRVSYTDLELLDSSGLAIQGERTKIFVYGAVNGIIRDSGLGGDYLTRIRVDQSVWKCVLVVERFYGANGEVRWTQALFTRQNTPPVFQNN